MNPVRQKIKSKFDTLENAMLENRHLDPNSIEEVIEMISACSIYFRVISESERDFLNAVRYAVEESKKWK
jgi:hypothetical protein